MTLEELSAAYNDLEYRLRRQVDTMKDLAARYDKIYKKVHGVDSDEEWLLSEQRNIADFKSKNDDPNEQSAHRDLLNRVLNDPKFLEVEK